MLTRNTMQNIVADEPADCSWLDARDLRGLLVQDCIPVRSVVESRSGDLASRQRVDQRVRPARIMQVRSGIWAV